MALRPLVPLLALALGCAHSPTTPDPDALRKASEDVNLRMRWGDDAGIAAHLVPERRAAFLARRRDGKTAQDLSITEVEPLDVAMAGDGHHAVVTERLHWVRLPSLSERFEDVRSSWEVRDGGWLLSAQQGGPFPELQP